MSPRVSSLSLLIVAGFSAGAGFSAEAQLASKSPFMPPAAATTTAPTASAPIQYVGYMEAAGGRQYRLYDPAKKVGTWVKLNERNPEFEVLAKQHDEGQKTLVVEYQGKVLTLAEREPKVVSSGSAAQALPPPIATPAPTNVPPAVTQAVVLNPTPADEQRRLQAVADEVTRRRALREQAAQQQANPFPANQVPLPQTIPPAQPQRNFQPGPLNPPQNGRGVQPAARQ
jgi:hypothetical protein